jgi:hypothetical protein
MARSLGPFCFVLLFVLRNGKNTSPYLTEREETMMVTIFQKKLGMAVLLVVLLGVACMGCSTTATEQQQGQPVTGPTTAGQAEWTEVGRVYLDDVRVPSELKYDADDSILYETTKFKAGVLHFSKWRLDVQSIIDFFMFNMVRDKWTFVNSFKGKETYLSFSKPDKTALIRITESWTGVVKVSIAVGPLGEKKN